ncbi:alpha/beta hydrolase [Corynebacterium pacaense]|uniref:alpha/beta hydrolase n=1 Tax=Corynebacterium pacaense TaxID=1816684 RepID=UPI0009B9D71D|nr:alpha/beta hydrolase [Corynebacterium pacaense]
MRLKEIDPRLRAAAVYSNIRGVDRPFMRGVLRFGMRHLPSLRVKGVGVRVVRSGLITMRVFEPEGERLRPGLLWIHGGGLVVGSARQDDRMCARTAAELDAVVVSVDYRLAPEHPYPAAIDDVHAAWLWLVDNAEQLEVNTSHLAIGGESAGGGLAACLVQRVHDEGGVQPVAQWLFAPMLDDRTAANTDLDAINHLVWNNKANRYGWSAYLGRSPGATVVPEYAAAARRADLTGLPPTWIYTTDLELFHDEVTTYAARLRDAGVDVELRTVPAAAHAFELMENTAPARELMAEARRWLGTTL